MFRFKYLFFRITVMAALGAALVLACGPFFGIEALQNRKQVLLAPPTVSFEEDLKALVPPPKDKLPVVEPNSPYEDVTNREKVETQELDPNVLVRIQTMRQQSSGEAARALGEGLPPAIQLYTAAAVSFLHGQGEAARGYLQDLVALPDNQRKSRELWACFLLGRIAVQQGNQAEAATQFEAVRTLVRQGTPDPLGLAVASFGEQARGFWKSGEVAKAVDLYARQASYGSQGGENSLVMVANLILKDNALLDQLIQDPLTRRLLFICVNGNSGRPFFIGDEAGNGSAAATADRLAAALERHHLTSVAGAGLLASAAYNQGRFDLAEKLSALENAPISSWVTAKLALRRGDREAALKAYDKALKSFPAAESTTIRAETAILRVSRGDYRQALDLFFRAAANGHRSEPGDDVQSDWFGFADYWGDVAYLSERVLTITELQDYVDHNPAATSGEKAEQSRLRSVLARRLMRAGQYREAVRYFDNAKIRESAEQYRQAIGKANSWWRFKLTKAEAWFAAANLARHNGMELLGFEREPDYAMWNGNFSDEGSPVTEKKPADPYQTEDERKRVAASRPERDIRFQYRLTAVDHAMKSADLLPASSQAYASVLCEATEWVIDRQPKLAEQVYQRYIHHGAYVPWGGSFGRQCPPPNFAAASLWSNLSRQEKHLTRKTRLHPGYAGLLALLLVAVPATLIYYVRMRRNRSSNLSNTSR